LLFPIVERKLPNGTVVDKVHGILESSIYWRSTVRNVLPENSVGIILVVTNPCSSAFTYKINGHNAVFLGMDDLHDSKYDDLEQHRTMEDLENNATQSIVYSGPGINDDFCPLTFHLYPSDDMKANFVTNSRIIFTVAAVCIFAFTSLVFYLYDLKVENRQRSILQTATRSTAIVSSLFPSGVRDRIFQSTQEECKKSKLEGILPETAKGRLQNFLRDGKTSAECSAANAPIAELYPETTVLFADIAGFTAWSSVRQPTQVFHLLESVYAAFDEIAKRRGVFKVETIGDSYVAVVGLPTPRKHHAVVMARFANDCRARMNDLVGELDKMLGPVSANTGYWYMRRAHRHLTQKNVVSLLRREPLIWPCALD
jgi:Adenylate and Guanylate cyclase catalytic domain